MPSRLSPDDGFWPPIASLFDVTLKFEETLLNILPSGTIVALSPVILFHYSKKPVYVAPSPLLWIKLIIAVALVGVEIASLVLRALYTDFRTETTLPAASLDLVAAVTITTVIFAEHRHAIRASALVSLYLILGVLIDAMKSRSFFKRPGLVSVGALAAVSSAIRLVLLLLEEIPKTRWLIDRDLAKEIGAEATSGFLSRTFFVFLNPLFLGGYRTVIVMQDLSNLGPDFASKLLHHRLRIYWKLAQDTSKSSLAMACFKAWKSLFLAVFIPRLAFSGFSFTQPFILVRVINVVGDPNASNQERTWLLVATAVSFIGSAVAKMTTAHMSNRQATRMRGGLIAELFNKNLRLPQSEARKSAAITLMTNDIDGIVNGLARCYDTIMTLIDLGIGIYLLSGFVGHSCFVVLIPLFLSTVSTYFLGKWIAVRFAAWNKSIQSRVAKTSRILDQLKAIKMIGLGYTIGSYLQQLRVIEISVSKKYRGLEAISIMPIVCAELITSVAVLAGAIFWGGFDGGLSAATVFPTLSLIVLIKEPLALLLYSYPAITTMFSCFQRVEDFLRLQERNDPRTIEARSDERVSRESSVPSSSPIRPIVEFVQAKIAPMGTQIPILQDISFKLYPGTITKAIGPNGAGKSLLLHSILGETSLIDGEIRIGEALVAFCDQTVWLQNISIKDNIIGPLPYEEELFLRILQCCLLEEDLNLLPGGIDYIVGSGGSKLSGGQRQRVGIARALYARLSIVVLDDIFSSLDRKTAVSILFRLCGEDGLLKELNSTVIISTSLSESFDVADQVLVLDGNGHAHLECNLKNDHSRRQMLSRLTPPTSLKSEEQEAKEQENIRRSREDQVFPSPNTLRENHVHQVDESSLYGFFIQPMGKVGLVLWTLLLLLASVGEGSTDIYIRLWIDRDPENTFYFIGYAGIAVVTCFLFSLSGAILFVHFVPRSANGLHQQAVDTMIGATIGYLGSTDNGVVLNRFSQDMSLIAQRLPLLLVRTTAVFFQTMIQSGVIASGASYMAVVLPLIAAAVFAIQRFYLRTSRQIRVLDLEARSPLYTHFQETAEGLLHIRAFGWQHRNLEDALALLDISQRAFYYQYCIQQWLGIVLGLLVAMVATILVAFALFLSNTTSETAIGLSFLNLIAFAKTLESLVKSWTGMETCITALERLREFMNNTPQEPTPPTSKIPENWPSMGNIELANVSARYDTGEEERPILSNITLSIDAGQKVAIIGRTGSGKSSLFLTLLGFLRYDGMIKIDGIDIASIPLEELRSRIVTISQDQIKLDATIRTNLLPFTLNLAPEKQDEKQKLQAEKKDIALRELLIRLGIWSQLKEKGGLDAQLDDVSYSQGEMQLFCIARGIMRYRDTGSKVVLIDEATSSVEYAREKIVHAVMKEHLAHCTILVIGHRKSSVRGAAFTVELSKGQVEHIDPTEPGSDDDGFSSDRGPRSP